MEEIIGKEFKQNCGDILVVNSKSDNKGYQNKSLYNCTFKKYPITLEFLKRDILRGSCINPEIERIEFLEKEWPQNCGDTLRIIKKSNKKYNTSYLWECEFLKYPCIIYSTKDNIIKGKIINPQIEIDTIIGKSFIQNCGDTLQIIEKSNIKEKNQFHYLYKAKFLKYPYEGLFRKEHILNGQINNPALPWYSKNTLEDFIKKNFKEKPTLKELSEKLKISYSGICNFINKYELQEFISYPYNLAQSEVFEEIKEIFPEETIYNKYFGEGLNKEIDVYIPSLKIGFEYNGNYWHSDLYKLSNYHQEKSLLFKQNQIKLIHIWEYEWINKKDILKNFIKDRLGIFDKKIGARQCQIKELDYKVYSVFCNENHLQETCAAKIKLGLFYKDELIQVMSFGCPRFTDKYEWEIIRECSKLGYCIVGGKERLWKYFLNKYQPNNCISYCDFSKFDGHSYLKLGFKKERLNKPGFVWWEENTNFCYQRTPWKHNEYKNRFLKIYDCGQLVFIWKKENLK